MRSLHFYFLLRDRCSADQMFNMSSNFAAGSVLAVILSCLGVSTQSRLGLSTVGHTEDSKPVRAAILYLVNDADIDLGQASSKIPQLRLTLSLLQRNFLETHPYPVYLFYTNEMSEDWKAQRSSLVPADLDVKWIFLPDFNKYPASFDEKDPRATGAPWYECFFSLCGTKPPHILKCSFPEQPEPRTLGHSTCIFICEQRLQPPSTVFLLPELL